MGFKGLSFLTVVFSKEDDIPLEGACSLGYIFLASSVQIEG